MKELYIDEPAKWKTRKLRQIDTDDPEGMDRKSCLFTILEYRVLVQLSTHAWLDQLNVFGAIPLSSILIAHLYTTLSSMTYTQQLKFFLLPVFFLSILYPLCHDPTTTTSYPNWFFFLLSIFLSILSSLPWSHQLFKFKFFSLECPKVTWFLLFTYFCNLCFALQKNT